MTPEQQQVAIAEACGWSNVKIYARPKANQRHSEDMEPICIGSRNLSWGGGSCSVPNYPLDLNAMHEVEKTLTVAQRITYANQIGVVLSGGSVGRAIPNWWFIHEATASQRAEAFLRTVGKWEESK